MINKTEFNVIIERDSEGFFIASVPELQGCHTQAKSLDVLMERIREAIQLCLEVNWSISALATSSGVIPRIQRKSIGHSLRKQGLQET